MKVFLVMLATLDAVAFIISYIIMWEMIGSMCDLLIEISKAMKQLINRASEKDELKTKAKDLK